jgi:putative endonuclease
MGQGLRARGAFGERLAARWYEQHGYTVLARNWRPAGRPDLRGELDLVVARPEVVVFCEVKARASAAFGVPAEAVTATKQARIHRLAGAWLAGSPQRWPAVRFDVAAVLGARLDILEAAF